MSRQMTYHRELDGLRWFAVTAVLIAHLPLIQGFAPWSYVKLLGGALRFGYLGVDVFFVLSGFLITRILCQEKAFSIGTVLKSFYAKRILRILPIYYVCIIYSWTVLDVSNSEALANVFFVSNYYYAFFDHASPLRHTWSLAVEEQFYILWPFLIMIVPLAVMSRVIFLLSVLVALLTVIIFWFSFSEETLNMLLVRATSFRLLSLSAGALLAINYQQLFEIDRRIVLILAAFVLPVVQAVIRFYEIPYSNMILVPAFTVWSVCIFLTVLLYGRENGGEHNLIGSVFRNAVIVYVGRISYGLYLYHLIILHQLDLRESYRPEGVSGLEFIFGLALCFGVATFSFEFFEKPILRLKSRYTLRANPCPKTILRLRD